MCKFIGVEVLAANALIDILELNNGMRSITLEDLNDYGIEVVDFIATNFKERAVVIYDNNRVLNLVIDYSEFFDYDNNVLSVKEGVTSDMLRERFRSPLSYEVLYAIIESTKKIFEAKNKRA